MTENEVNTRCREWLISKGYHYKGILNSRKLTLLKSNAQQPNEVESKSQKTSHSRSSISKESGCGQVRVPDGSETNCVLLDHQGFRDSDISLIWIEAKGSGCNLSELLEGFIRTVYGVYYGGGNGYLAIPHNEYEKLLEQKDFLKAVAESVNGKGTMGLLDAEKGVLIEF